MELINEIERELMNRARNELVRNQRITFLGLSAKQVAFLRNYWEKRNPAQHIPE